MESGRNYLDLAHRCIGVGPTVSLPLELFEFALPSDISVEVWCIQLSKLPSSFLLSSFSPYSKYEIYSGKALVAEYTKSQVENWEVGANFYILFCFTP